jgi:hypothetical protein
MFQVETHIGYYDISGTYVASGERERNEDTDTRRCTISKRGKKRERHELPCTDTIRKDHTHGVSQ